MKMSIIQVLLACELTVYFFESRQNQIKDLYRRFRRYVRVERVVWRDGERKMKTNKTLVKLLLMVYRLYITAIRRIHEVATITCLERS